MSPFGPLVSQEGNTLTIRNDRRIVLLLSLFVYLRRVDVMLLHARIVVSTRKAWFFYNERRFSFKDISYIDYSGHAEYGKNERGATVHVTDRMRIDLVTQDGERVCIYRYFGRTAAEHTSRLVGWLSDKLALPIGKHGTPPEPLLKCPGCGRETSPKRAKCPFCAHPLR